MIKTQLILLCAGKSSRFDDNKILANLNGKTVLQTNLDNINSCEKIEKIFVVQSSDSKYENLGLQSKIPLQFVVGGDSRTQSVKNALKYCDCDVVLVHDGARPFAKSFDECIDTAKKYGSAIPVVPVTDTIKIVSNDTTKTLSRENLFAVQTPQGFLLDNLLKAYEFVGEGDFFDDSSVYEKLFGSVKCYDSLPENKKITYKSDLNSSDLRVGNGYDIHELRENRPLILGGIKIDSPYGLVGHSDADVLLHSITDAILSASGNKDIGNHFPDTDEKYKNADSTKLLEQVLDKISLQGYFIINISATIICQSPKLAPYIHKIKQNLARICEVDLQNIGISAKTNEKFGLVGQNKAICVFSSCLLAKIQRI